MLYYALFDRDSQRRTALTDFVTLGSPPQQTIFYSTGSELDCQIPGNGHQGCGIYRRRPKIDKEVKDKITRNFQVVDYLKVDKKEGEALIEL